MLSKTHWLFKNWWKFAWDTTILQIFIKMDILPSAALLSKECSNQWISTNLQMFITRANFHQFQKSWWVLESIFHGQQDSNLSNSSPTIFYWLFEQFIWMYVQNLLNTPFLINFFKTAIIQLKLHQIGQSQVDLESSGLVL